MRTYRVKYFGGAGPLWSAEYKYLAFAQKRARALLRYGWIGLVIIEYDENGEAVRETRV